MHKPVTQLDLLRASVIGFSTYNIYSYVRKHNLVSALRNNWLSLTATACAGTGLWYLYHKWYPSRDGGNGFGEFFAPIEPVQIFVPESTEQLQKIITAAAQKKQKISIIGAGKSQGGQVATPDAIMIDLKKLDKVVRLDVENKQVTVQTGITWKKLQEILNVHDLAIKAMQSYADFSIGGSLSVSAHGQDFNSGTVSDTVISFKLLGADGKLMTVSKTENKELFTLALGGYGLFGIIIEVTLELTKDVLLRKESCTMETEQYANYFLKSVKNDPLVALHSARLSISPSALFEEVVVVTYKTAGDKKDLARVIAPQNSKRDQFFFNGMRKYAWVKEIRILLENYFERPEIITRNNAMGASIVNIKNGVKNTRDMLQEYFVPVDQLDTFIKALKNIITTHKVNLLNATIRYVKKTEHITLSYAPQDSFAIVLFVNVPDSERGYRKAQLWTQELIDQTLKLSGTYYLPYQLFATRTQLTRAYPNFEQFIASKKKYDPAELFTNELYKKYAD